MTCESRSAPRARRGTALSSMRFSNTYWRVIDDATLSSPAQRAAVEHLATMLPCSRPHVDDPVSVSDDLELVLDHEQRVAGFFQCLSARSSAAVSAGCNPADGSSST